MDNTNNNLNDWCNVFNFCTVTPGLRAVPCTEKHSAMCRVMLKGHIVGLYFPDDSAIVTAYTIDSVISLISKNPDVLN